MIRLGLIGGWELTDCPIADPSHVDYGQVIPWKEKVSAFAYSRFLHRNAMKFQAWTSLSRNFVKATATGWMTMLCLWYVRNYTMVLTGFTLPDESRCPTLNSKLLFKSMHEDIEYYRFIQFLFFDEWKRIKKYANDHGIRIIGDILIFVSMDSADGRTSICSKLISKGYLTLRSRSTAGLFFSHRQLWGNPLYKLGSS